MFTPGTLLYINDFEFENSQPTRNKYVLILCNQDLKSIIITLPSSKDHIPDQLKQEGCIYVDRDCIHCYYIPKNKSIGVKGFQFQRDTYIYIQQNIREKEIEDFENRYSERIVVKDRLTDDYFIDILMCILEGKFVARKIKSLIKKMID